jgi:hypothetical protein
MVHDPALGAGVVIRPSESPPRMVLRVLPQPSAQRSIRIRRRSARRLVSLRCPVLPANPACEPLTHVHARHEVVHCRAPTFRAQEFPRAISFNAAFSSSASASSRLSVEFTRSSSLSRFASSALRPPN